MSDTPQRLPIAQAPLSVLLTAYNVSPELEEVLAHWNGYLNGLARPYEILLVNDGSTDETAQRAGALAGQMPHVHVLTHERHLGAGAALRTGLAAARHPLIVTASCDKQYQAPDLYRLLEAIDQVDLVTGYRVSPMPALVRLGDLCRRILARVFLGAVLESRNSWAGWASWRRRWRARWLFGVRVQDPECPYRLYRREVLQRVPIQCDSSAAEIEILAKANHLECVMAEVPVSWIPAEHVVMDPFDRRSNQELRRLFLAPEFTHVSSGLAGRR